jgi:hypothetical protein
MRLFVPDLFAFGKRKGGAGSAALKIGILRTDRNRGVT